MKIQADGAHYLVKSSGLLSKSPNGTGGYIPLSHLGRHSCLAILKGFAEESEIQAAGAALDPVPLNWEYTFTVAAMDIRKVLREASMACSDTQQQLTLVSDIPSSQHALVGSGGSVQLLCTDHVLTAFGYRVVVNASDKTSTLLAFAVLHRLKAKSVNIQRQFDFGVDSLGTWDLSNKESVLALLSEVTDQMQDQEFIIANRLFEFQQWVPGTGKGKQYVDF